MNIAPPCTCTGLHRAAHSSDVRSNPGRPNLCFKITKFLLLSVLFSQISILSADCPAGSYGYSKSCQGVYYLSNDNVGGHADALLHSLGSGYPSTLMSSRGGYKVVMQTDGNLVIYTSGMVPVWSTGTWYSGTGAYRLVLQIDGYAHSPVPPPHLVHWHGVLCIACEVMNRIYTAAKIAPVSFHRNLVLYNQGGTAVWNSQSQNQGTPPRRLIMRVNAT